MTVFRLFWVLHTSPPQKNSRFQAVNPTEKIKTSEWWKIGGDRIFFSWKNRAKNCTMLHLLYFLTTCGGYLFEGDNECDCDAELYMKMWMVIENKKKEPICFCIVPKLPKLTHDHPPFWPNSLFFCRRSEITKFHHGILWILCFCIEACFTTTSISKINVACLH